MSVLDKPSSEWTEADLKALVAGGIEERLELEYKRCAALIPNPAKTKEEICDELSKDVSAFANSAGGTLVYGIIEDRHKPTGVDAGFDPAALKKEWIEDVIHGRIHPKIEGLLINPVALQSGKVAYVISIPQSATAHQAGDKRYYKRHNFKAEPMEDYEIRDIMARLKFPRLIPHFTARFIDNRPLIEVLEYALNISLRNEGVMAAQRWKLVLWIPQSLALRQPGFSGQVIEQLQSAVFGAGWFKQHVKGDEVIFPEDELVLVPGRAAAGMGREFVYRIDTRRIGLDDRREPFLLWKTYADNMPPLNGSVLLADISHPLRQ